MGMVWGTPEEAERAAAAVRGIHEQVTGPGYFAGDPELQTWVDATLTETAVDLYGRLFGPLPEPVAEQLRSVGGASHLVPRPVRHRAPELFVRMARHRAGQTVSR
jgi:hypothetical protein